MIITLRSLFMQIMTTCRLGFSDERVLPNDADVDADWPGGHGGAQVPASQGQPEAGGHLAQERSASQPHGLQEDSHH